MRTPLLIKRAAPDSQPVPQGDSVVICALPLTRSDRLHIGVGDDIRSERRVASSRCSLCTVRSPPTLQRRKGVRRTISRRGHGASAWLPIVRSAPPHANAGLAGIRLVRTAFFVGRSYFLPCPHAPYRCVRPTNQDSTTTCQFSNPHRTNRKLLRDVELQRVVSPSHWWSAPSSV